SDHATIRTRPCLAGTVPTGTDLGIEVPRPGGFFRPGPGGVSVRLCFGGAPRGVHGPPPPPLPWAEVRSRPWEGLWGYGSARASRVPCSHRCPPLWHASQLAAWSERATRIVSVGSVRVSTLRSRAAVSQLILPRSSRGLSYIG